MTTALQAMAELAGPGRNQVVIPAYTCYSVAAAVERAGLVPVPCEVNPRTLGMDLEHLERLQTGATLAIVSASLFGIPDELSAIEQVARRSGVYFLDDAAQALGARVDGRPAGGFGDAGLFSFDKGKNISTIQGGALVARDGPLLGRLEKRSHGLEGSSAASTAALIAKALLYGGLLRPAVFGVVRRLPMLRLGETLYETDFPLRALSGAAQGLALLQLSRLPELQRARVARAQALRQALGDLPGLRFVEQQRPAEAVYPRFPLFAASRDRRDRLLAALDRSGIGASGMYPCALPDVPQVARLMPRTSCTFAGAREVADTVVTLPTHGYTPMDLPARIRAVLLRAVRE